MAIIRWCLQAAQQLLFGQPSNRLGIGLFYFFDCFYEAIYFYIGAYI